MKAEFLRGEEYTTIRMAEGRPFRILQLTDIHLGGGWLSCKKDRLALDAVEKVVRAANADFIVVTGDMVYPMFMFSGTSNNLKATRMFADKMESLGVPWTCVFGNHDEEPIAFYKKERLADYYESLKCCFFRKGEKDITGVGNQTTQERLHPGGDQNGENDHNNIQNHGQNRIGIRLESHFPVHNKRGRIVAAEIVILLPIRYKWE